MSGNALNAFKARVPVTWSPGLFITLVRGLPGTRKLHRRTLAAMLLRCCNRTVIHRTTPSLLGMLNRTVNFCQNFHYCCNQCRISHFCLATKLSACL
ncbi:hypothetical protein KSP39_PZI023345 [Platanthera zijinensis]|uniref:Large ribosomal subunit protein uL30m n=1 Tax=Platanthera zijinensis TaxID=2320716 RepID=A0AAP0AVN3_9ASPA